MPSNNCKILKLVSFYWLLLRYNALKRIFELVVLCSCQFQNSSRNIGELLTKLLTPYPFPRIMFKFSRIKIDIIELRVSVQLN